LRRTLSAMAWKAWVLKSGLSPKKTKPAVAVLPPLRESPPTALSRPSTGPVATDHGPGRFIALARPRPDLEALRRRASPAATPRRGNMVLADPARKRIDPGQSRDGSGFVDPGQCVSAPMALASRIFPQQQGTKNPEEASLSWYQPR
jgi:hypothetical protein